MLKILVTGANGFVGKNLVDKLLKENCEVYALARQPIAQNHPHLHPIVAEMSQDFESLLPSSVDIVIHMAQSKQYRNVPDGIADMFDINTHVTFRLLEWARKAQIKKFIFTSTGNVYGISQQNLLQETQECKPDSFYAASKFAAEKYIEQYKNYFEVVILRLFGIYGIGQKDMTIPNLIQRLKNQQPFTLAKDIGLAFTPLYVDDCIEMIWRLSQPTKLDDIIFNVGGNEIVTIKQIVELAAQKLNLTPQFISTDAPPTYLSADINRIVKTTQFTPQINIQIGISRILS